MLLKKDVVQKTDYITLKSKVNGTEKTKCRKD